MFPIICKIGPVTVYSYGLMLAIAFVIATALAGSQAKRENLNPEIIFNFAFFVFIGGIIGARIFFILESTGYYLKNPHEIIMLQYGGLSWFGGLFLGLASGLIFLKIKKLPKWKLLDLITPYIALAQAIGRIGCFLNGCCFGKPANIGIYSKAQNAVLIPTQIYSSLSLILIFLVLRFLQDKPHRDGQIVFAYLLLYSVQRFLIEFWRGDNQAIFFNLSLFQLISSGLFIFAFAGLLFISKKT